MGDGRRLPVRRTAESASLRDRMYATLARPGVRGVRFTLFVVVCGISTGLLAALEASNGWSFFVFPLAWEAVDWSLFGALEHARRKAAGRRPTR